MAQFEAELKFPVPSFEQFVTRAHDLGVSFQAEVTQSDVYFNHPARDFADTNEALRIRTTPRQTRITYKGPVLDQTVKLRREIELPVGRDEGDTQALSELLTALSFREVRTVTKQRQSAHLHWHGRDFELTLDRVDGLGLFVEIETLCEDGDIEAARDAVVGLSREFGLKQHESRSYLELLLEQDGETHTGT